VFKEASEKMDANESITVLQQQQFSQVEIERLVRLRKSLWEKQIRQDTVARRRLEFIRWLVQTGRINEQEPKC
jgi:hypothetical protein